MDILNRFSRKMREERDIDKIIDSASVVFDSQHGEEVLSHLVEHFGLDDPAGSLEASVAAYRNGTQDAIKYILALANDKKTRSR
jgi:hypothetical protein